MKQILKQIKGLNLSLKILILCLVVLISTYYSYDSYYTPALTELATAQTEEKRIESEVQEINSFSGQVQQIEKDIHSAKWNLKSLMHMLPKELEYDKILSYITATAQETGLKIKDFLPDGKLLDTSTIPVIPEPPPKKTANGKDDKKAIPEPVKQPTKNVSEFGIHLVMEGSYSEALSFFDKLMNLPRIIKIQDVDMSHIEADAKKNLNVPRLKIEAKISSFYQDSNLLDGVDI